MIIEIDGYQTHALLKGKVHNLPALKKQINETYRLSLEQGDFVALFCRRYNFEPIAPCVMPEPIQADYVVDLDTLRIYRPKY